jgi:excinuclease ABC subunit C
MFDMSNFYGQDKIGAMITLKDGEFSKNLYRKFIIKDKKSKSDGEYMYECIYRQYAKKENQNVQLIIVDGGIIQVNAAKKALGELNLNIPVIGLTKNQDHKLEYITIDKNKNININKKTNLYLFLFNMQEEVHRYAITFFKKKNTLIKQ